MRLFVRVNHSKTTNGNCWIWVGEIDTDATESERERERTEECLQEKQTNYYSMEEFPNKMVEWMVCLNKESSSLWWVALKIVICFWLFVRSLALVRFFFSFWPINVLRIVRLWFFWLLSYFYADFFLVLYSSFLQLVVNWLVEKSGMSISCFAAFCRK